MGEETVSNSSAYELVSSWVGDGGSTLHPPSPLQRGSAIKGPRQPSQDIKQVHSSPIDESTRQMSIAVSTDSQCRRNGTGEREGLQHLNDAKTLPRTGEPRGAAPTHGAVGSSRVHDVIPAQCKQPASANMTLPPQGMRNAGQTNVSGERTRQFFKSFGERFVKEVRSKDNTAFTAKLNRQNVISESIKTRIAKADDHESANSLLYDFLSQQLTPESLRILLTVMAEAKDHPAMSQLGRDMKKALEMTIPTAAAGSAPGRRGTHTM